MDTASPTPARSARGAATDRTLWNSCARCAQYLFKGDHYKANFGLIMKKKCEHCVKGHHPCEKLHHLLIVPFNDTIRTWEALQSGINNGIAAPALRTLQEAFDDRNKQWLVELRTYHNNKSKIVSDSPVPKRKRNAAVAFGNDELTIVEMQKIRRGIFTLVEASQELLRVSGGNLDHMDRAMGEDFVPNEEEEANEEEEDEEEDKDEE